MALRRSASQKAVDAGYDIPFCLSLLSLFDFGQSGHVAAASNAHPPHLLTTRLGCCAQVSREDWRKGTKTLHLATLGEDDKLWELLLEQYDPFKSGVIDLAQLQDLLSMDPRMSLLLNAMLQTITALNSTVEAAERKKQKEAEARKKRVSPLRHLNHVTPRMCGPPVGRHAGGAPAGAAQHPKAHARAGGAGLD